ncbi:F0F1 ATP synthase subunit B [soil metagenome]
MDLLTPSIGLVFWTTVSFLILLILLSKFAWKPILTSVKERENRIVNAVMQAEQARAEMAALSANNERLLNEAREERAIIIKEAKAVGDKLIADAKDKAGVEFNKKVADASREIENQKMAALTEVKNYAGQMALEIAEKVLKKEFSDRNKQESFASQLVDDLKLN